MPVVLVVAHDASPPEEQPEVTLVHYSVYRTEAGSRHFVGFNEQSGKWRFSTAIAGWDVDTMSGRTQSGRLYRLVGPPCADGATRIAFPYPADDVTGEYAPSASNSPSMRN